MAIGKAIPPIYGLVLAGGKSNRMGQDKGEIEYHGKPQREFAYALLETLCERTFLSLRSDQEADIPEAFQTVTDQDRFRGPLNGILSAHALYPEAAWLVLACDLPLMDRDSLRLLIDERDPSRMATAFATGKSGLPEPLAAIWEPRGLRHAISYMENAESSCPRKFLIRSDTRLVTATDDTVLANANDPQEREAILEKLNQL
ncbi:NTP transferase domain-containing protein [Robiginitalea sp. SC105]|uniref:NTP transferase domain-containing protein n=1 Tax=Robiginitalea sp. SC105 TaxID=2762332 RepID=UPI00163A4C38|nr:NTP transferase domain-containing protein [Robiginitalea sp. SC105]MBC2840563.1 NTP transferase domain-containing protein [Robiginitalea sp. SC105]